MTAVALSALMLVVPATMSLTTANQAFASGATGTLDANGLMRLDPIAGYSYSIGNEYYINDCTKNFRSDGSERIDCTSKNIGDDGFIIAGYVDVVKGAGNDPNICSTQSAEEISTKVNGGPHTGPVTPGPSTFTDITPWPSENSADTMDVGNINFAGTTGRLRTEVTHPSPLVTVPQYDAAGNTYPGVDLCHASPDNKIGFMTVKMNMDSNCDGVYDKVYLVSFIDTSGYGTDGKPQNKWTKSQGGYRTGLWIFGPNDTGLKSIFEYWGRDPSVNHGADSATTLRIDHQSQSAWQSTSDPPYTAFTVKELTNVHKDTCPTVNAVDPGATHPGTDDSGFAGAAATTAANTTATEDSTKALAQEDSPQSEDNNDVTSDDSGTNNNDNTADDDENDNSNNNNNDDDDDKDNKKVKDNKSDE